MINNKLSEFFIVESDNKEELLTLSHVKDSNKMNWVEGDTPWGTTKAPRGIKTTIQRSVNDKGNLVERYEFTNTTDFDIFTEIGDIGIYTTFNDDYTTSKECLTNKCHAHIWCGNNISYIMGLRMGGEGPHLGLILTKGSISQYSVERNIERISNDRGDFILHPSPVSLTPKQSFTIEWELFWHNGKEDFQKQLFNFSHYYSIKADKFVYFQNEDIEFWIEGIRKSDTKNIIVSKNKKTVPFTYDGKNILIHDENLTSGVHKYFISINDIYTNLSILVLPNLNKLSSKRCDFIVNKQQYKNENSSLNNAYLIYDNEENHTYYSHRHDHNGGRERFGMGVLIAKYLQHYENSEYQESLNDYIAYIKRELYDDKTGIVYNDINRNNDIHRLYNYTWLAVLFKEKYLLSGNIQELRDMYKVMMGYYKNEGKRFYPIEIPMSEMLDLMKKEKLHEEASNLFSEFQKHVESILKYGVYYPPSEVNFEQTIVAPAADCLIEMYLITNEEKYLKEAKKHIDILDLFNGDQPDYRLHETSIRHWDGYWFGKNELYGDTFPHYWSGYSGRVFHKYAIATSDNEYFRKAENSLRGVLSLFFEDGSASCAHLYPLRINQQKGDFSDPWSNDQDWGLYFVLDFYKEIL